MPQEDASSAAELPAPASKRVEGWTHYYEYFHKLDADIQVCTLHQRGLCPCASTRVRNSAPILPSADMKSSWVCSTRPSWLRSDAQASPLTCCHRCSLSARKRIANALSALQTRSGSTTGRLYTSKRTRTERQCACRTRAPRSALCVPVFLAVAPAARSCRTELRGVPSARAPSRVRSD